MSTLIDSNVILDVIIPDPKWLDWSASYLSQCADAGDVIINPIVYAETSVRYLNGDEFDRILRHWFDRGVAGFRIDVAHMIVKDAELRDNRAATDDDFLLDRPSLFGCYF